MKKRMLCVLALTMAGLTLSTAETGGRRSRSYSSNSYWGGGSAPATSATAGQPVYVQTADGRYVLYYPSEATGQPAQQASGTQSSYSVSGSSPVNAPSNGAPVYTTAPTYVPSTYYYPATGYSSFSGSFGSYCSGGG